jgi:hypothetical protein
VDGWWSRVPLFEGQSANRPLAGASGLHSRSMIAVFEF